MKILIDIGHPAHLHYFRNFMALMQKQGHTFRITARKKDVTFELLKNYGIPFIDRGLGGKNLISKFLYFIKGDLIILNASKIFKPDILISFASPYLAQVSFLTGIPHIVLDDTEHNKWNHRLYVPFSDTILTPSVFYKRFGPKHILFDSYMELNYLYPKYFNSNITGHSILNINPQEKYIVLRFISWNANHDIGEKGLSFNYKLKLVKELSKYFRLYISSENTLPKEFQEYRLNINPIYMHHVLANASLYIGEGSTTASECSVLGTPNIYVSSLFVSNCSEQEQKYGLSFHFKNENGVLEKAKELLSIPNIKEEWQKRRNKMLADKIDATAFLVWFIENYPDSVKVMKENPNYQYNFK